MQKIFVNLPVRDLKASIAFYEAIGGRRDPLFGDDTAVGMAFSDAVFVMLLTRERFAGFTPKPVADGSTCEVLICLSRETREAVDTTVEAAVTAGGRPDPNPPMDCGPMYGRSVDDPDGHTLEFMHMDMAAFTEAREQELAGVAG